MRLPRRSSAAASYNCCLPSVFLGPWCYTRRLVSNTRQRQEMFHPYTWQPALLLPSSFGQATGPLIREVLSRRVRRGRNPKVTWAQGGDLALTRICKLKGFGSPQHEAVKAFNQLARRHKIARPRTGP